MQATLLGAQADYSLVMNMLSSYLWPLDERRIAEWLFAGVSLGGHMVWRLLREDPRVRVGVPIASVPPETLAMFITGSGSEYDIPVEGTAAAVRDYFSTQTLPSDFTGKHILSLHGGADPIMGLNRMQDTLTRIGAYADHFEIYAEPGIGHQVTPEMVRRTAAWFWRFGMCEEGAKL
jgi:hypothetical protein